MNRLICKGSVGGFLGLAVAATLWLSVGTTYAQVHRGPKGGQLNKRQQRALKQAPSFIQFAINQQSKLVYRGTRTVQLHTRNGFVSRVELVIRSGAKERIEYPSGSPYSGQIIVNDGSLTRHYNPRRMTIDQKPSPNQFGFLRSIITRYRRSPESVQIESGSSIANQPTTLVTLLDLSGVPTQRLWLDNRTGAILKRIGYDTSGNEVAGFTYSQISYGGSFPASTFELNVSGAKIEKPIQNLKRLSRNFGIDAIELPESSGFSLVSCNIAKRAGHRFLVQVYSGTRGPLSLFIVKGPVNGATLRAKAAARSNVSVTKWGELSVVMIGNYPEQELEQFSSELVKV